MVANIIALFILAAVIVTGLIIYSGVPNITWL